MAKIFAADFYQPAFARLLPPSARVLVAFSGGRDSTALLHMLRYGWAGGGGRLRAIHVHHGISPRADSWSEHCQRICAGWQVPLELARVRLANDGQGLEAQARQARYAAFAKALQPAECLLMAHHQDDQAETLLLALKRGSGPAGLAAMPERLAFADGVIVRPLLAFSGDLLAEYARYHQLSWIEDESNQDDRYDRNFLRLRVLPPLCQRWGHFPAALARSAQLCGEQEQLLDELLGEDLARVVRPGGGIAIAPLQGMSAARRGAVLRRWLRGQGAAMPSRETLWRLWQEVAQSRQDARARLRLGGSEVRRFQQALWLIPVSRGAVQAVIPWLAPFSPLSLPDGIGRLVLLADAGGSTDAGRCACVRPPAAGEAVTVRFQAPGLWQIAGRSRRRSLKKLWQGLAVPPWLRGRIPLLFYNETLIAAPGFFVTEAGLPGQEKSWNPDWQQQV